jgi:hypothetical protein
MHVQVGKRLIFSQCARVPYISVFFRSWDVICLSSCQHWDEPTPIPGHIVTCPHWVLRLPWGSAYLWSPTDWVGSFGRRTVLSLLSHGARCDDFRGQCCCLIATKLGSKTKAFQCYSLQNCFSALVVTLGGWTPLIPFSAIGHRIHIACS